jgi:hypothetical protein
VVVADVTEGFLPQLGNEIAEAALIEEGTPLVGGELEAGRVGLAVNTKAEPLTDFSRDGIVIFQCFFVHVDLPAHTAGVTA